MKKEKAWKFRIRTGLYFILTPSRWSVSFKSKRGRKAKLWRNGTHRRTTSRREQWVRLLVKGSHKRKNSVPRKVFSRAINSDFFVFPVYTHYRWSCLLYFFCSSYAIILGVRSKELMSLVCGPVDQYLDLIYKLVTSPRWPGFCT